MRMRLDYMKAAPDAVEAVVALDDYVVRKSGLDQHIIDLVKLRASQTNGCAFCVDMHTKEARAHGMSEQRIALTCVWAEASVFDARERAALRWTDAVTEIGETGAPDADFEALRVHFTDEEIVKLTVAIGTINVWNRLAVGFRVQHPVDAAA